MIRAQELEPVLDAGLDDALGDAVHGELRGPDRIKIGVEWPRPEENAIPERGVRLDVLRIIERGPVRRPARVRPHQPFGQIADNPHRLIQDPFVCP